MRRTASGVLIGLAIASFASVPAISWAQAPESDPASSGPASVVTQRFQPTATFKVPSDRALATAVRQSITRESERLWEAASDQAQQPATTTKSWASQHRKALTRAAIIGAIAGVVLYAVTHPRG